MKDLIQSVSKQIGVAQWYLSSQYLNHLPLPNLFLDYYSEVDQDYQTNKLPLILSLSKIGNEMSKGKVYSEDDLNYFMNLAYDNIIGAKDE